MNKPRFIIYSMNPHYDGCTRVVLKPANDIARDLFEQGDFALVRYADHRQDR